MDGAADRAKEREAVNAARSSDPLLKSLAFLALFCTPGARSSASPLIAEFFVRRLQSICNASAMEGIEMSRETSAAKAMQEQWKSNESNGRMQ
jgi:hypothetical protein